MVNEIPNIAKFRPMLSAKLPCAHGDVPTQEEVIRDLERLDWSRGFMCSPKIDGIRAIKHPELGLVSRTLKPIPNQHIQKTLNLPEFDYFDGELIAGRLSDMYSYNDSQSAIMTASGEPEFTYCVFDWIEQPDTQFIWRNSRVCDTLGDHFFSNVVYLPQTLVTNIDSLLKCEEQFIEQGFEGMMFRDPGGAYKNGRATFKQQGLTKLKRFLDAEAVIVGFRELERNTNEAVIDDLGYTKRSAHKAGKVAADTLGLLEVQGTGDHFKGIGFEIGSGFDEATRDLIWRNRDAYLGLIVKYKYQPHGVKDKPRAPIFLGFRSEEDM